MIKTVFWVGLAALATALSGCVGYYDDEPCPDGSRKRRLKPRHGPSLFVCPDETLGKAPSEVRVEPEEAEKTEETESDDDQ